MSMNVFRLAGDLSHLTGILILLYRLCVAKTASGTCRRDTSILELNGVDTLTLTLSTIVAIFACEMQEFRCEHKSYSFWYP
jgi:hypothetical protein